MLPCLVFEDDHLLVVNKPAGMNTHAPSPYAGEGIYDWLRNREPRWSKLAIIHRLDKETSGLILFSKTPLANASLTKQFTERKVRKKYVFLTDRPVPEKELLVKTLIVRAGEKYVSRTGGRQGQEAVTRFRGSNNPPAKQPPSYPDLHWMQAEPLTGRTHQIRVHAAENGFPILGDKIYGGSEASRVYLHATGIELHHPADGRPLSFNCPPDFETDGGLALREALIDQRETDACRLCHGASDHWPGWYIDRLGNELLSQSDHTPTTSDLARLSRWVELTRVSGASHKVLSRQIGKRNLVQNSPQNVLGNPAPDAFTIRENGLNFEQRFSEGYSVGLFLDQRDNRRRILSEHIAAGFPLFTRKTAEQVRVLNLFAYTCGFSVCAAIAGAHTTSVDLSKKYLHWGKRNFELNGLDHTKHDFIFGDAFTWLRRLARKQNTYDLVLLDPPTFSQSKESGAFRVERDYTKLLALALPSLKRGGVLFASTNAAEWQPEEFLSAVHQSIRAFRGTIVQQHYAPQPPDFPISRAEPGYLKTVWLRIERPPAELYR